jgi:tyrosinase
LVINRPNQRNLTSQDWTNLINAINSMHGVTAQAPAYRDFVSLHVQAMSMSGFAWHVHTMPKMGMIGTNFLPWHRQLLYSFEKRLGLPLPYWDWINDPQIPAALNDPNLLKSWSVTREWDPSEMPTADQLATDIKPTKFSVFQRRLELGVHDSVHVAIGGQNGTMDSPSSPADPIFFLHHANLDRIWSEWQVKNPNSKPNNLNDTLMPGPPIEGTKISNILDIASLGYSYAP